MTLIRKTASGYEEVAEKDLSSGADYIDVSMTFEEFVTKQREGVINGTVCACGNAKDKKFKQCYDCYKK